MSIWQRLKEMPVWDHIEHLLVAAGWGVAASVLLALADAHWAATGIPEPIPLLLVALFKWAHTQVAHHNVETEFESLQPISRDFNHS